jgi:hypothetical protein
VATLATPPTDNRSKTPIDADNITIHENLLQHTINIKNSPIHLNADQGTLTLNSTIFSNVNARTALKVSHINARSLVPKLYMLYDFMQISLPDILLITESWCCSDHSNDLLHIPGYKLFRKDRNYGRGGGCVGYVSSDLTAVTLQSQLLDSLEDSLWIHLTEFNLIIGCIYNPPQADALRLELITEAIYHFSSLTAEHKVIMGDFNMPEVNWSHRVKCAKYKSFTNAINILGNTQLINIPTRNENILDLLFVLNVPTNSVTVNPPLQGCDHRIISCNLLIRKFSEKTKNIFLRSLKIDWDSFTHYIRYLNWDTFFLTHNINTACTQFVDNITTCLSNCSSASKRFINRPNNVELKLSKLKRSYQTTRDVSIFFKLTSFPKTC